MAAGHHGVRDDLRRRRAQVRHAAALHQAAGAGVALPRRDLLAVDGLLLHDQRASAGRHLHRAPDASRQGLGRARRLPHPGAALHGAGRLLQPGFRRAVLPARRAVRQHGRADPSLDHQGRLRRRSVAGGARNLERAVARDRLPVRRQAGRRSQSADRPRRERTSSPNRGKSPCSTGWPTTSR